MNSPRYTKFGHNKYPVSMNENQHNEPCSDSSLLCFSWLTFYSHYGNTTHTETLGVTEFEVTTKTKTTTNPKKQNKRSLLNNPFYFLRKHTKKTSQWNEETLLLVRIGYIHLTRSINILHGSKHFNGFRTLILNVHPFISVLFSSLLDSSL